MTAEEVKSLLNVAGEDRELDMTAIYTALRRNELRQLVWNDLHLTAEAPYVRARVATTKNGKDASIPLRLEVADALKAMRPESVKGTDQVFMVPNRNKKLYEDLRAAGIGQKDSQGGIVDVHAFRHTCGTLLAQSGVHPSVAQEFMRHSDIRMTMGYYTYVDQFATTGAVQKMPWLGDASLLIPSHKCGPKRPTVSRDDAKNGKGDLSQVPVAEHERRAEAQHVATGQENGKVVRATGLEPVTSTV